MFTKYINVNLTDYRHLQHTFLQLFSAHLQKASNHHNWALKQKNQLPFMARQKKIKARTKHIPFNCVKKGSWT